MLRGWKLIGSNKEYAFGWQRDTRHVTVPESKRIGAPWVGLMRVEEPKARGLQLARINCAGLLRVKEVKCLDVGRDLFPISFQKHLVKNLVVSQPIAVNWRTAACKRVREEQS